MEDLIKLSHSTIDLGLVQDVVMDKIETMNLVAISIDRADACDEIRTNNNNYIKGIKEVIDEEKELYLKPFNEMVQPILDSIKPLEIATKDFANKILETKKEAFKLKVKEEWMNIGMALDGLLPPFEKVFDEKWYGKPSKVWKMALAERIQKENRRNDTNSFTINLDCDYNTLAEVESFLISKGIFYNVKVRED